MIRAPVASGAVPQKLPGGGSPGSDSAASPERGSGTAPLTPAQTRTLDAIRLYQREHGYTPGIRTVAAMLGLRSSSTVYQHLKQLVKKGRLRILGRKGIVLLPEPGPGAVELAEAARRVTDNAQRYDAGTRVEGLFYGDVCIVRADLVEALRRAIS